MAKRSRPRKSMLKTTKQLFRIQQNLANKAAKQLPQQLKAANILLTKPDPQKRGDWRKHVFIAPLFNQERLVQRLDYYVFTPSPTLRHPHTKGMPLVVMLHGCHQDAALFAQGTQMNVLAQRNGFVVLYPQQSRQHHIGNCWRWHELNDKAALAEAHSILKIIHSTLLMHQLDPGKVFICGLSAGAAMAGILAANFPAQFAAVAMHSGPVLGRAHNSTSVIKVMLDDQTDDEPALLTYMRAFAAPKRHQMPTIIIQGEADKVVHPRNAEDLLKQFLYLNAMPTNSLGSAQSYYQGSKQQYEQRIYRDGHKRMLELILVKHLDHAWAGGDDRLPFNSKSGPNSAQLIWQFFKRHLSRQG